MNLPQNASSWSLSGRNQECPSRVPVEDTQLKVKSQAHAAFWYVIMSIV